MKKILLIIINSLLLTSSYAINKQDSVYYDLFQFLILKGNIPKEMNWVLKCDSSKQYLYIFDILKDDFPCRPDFVNIPFGIYKFQYVGCIDCGFYVLIKYNESYIVFPQTEIPLIIKELIKIQKNDPGLINNKLFETYIETIIEDYIGTFPTKRNIIFHRIGHIDFIDN